MIIPIISTLVAGAATWTLLEYIIHRWLGHDARTRPNFFASEHIRHHSEGSYFAPVHKKFLSAFIAGVLIIAPAIFFGGFVLGTSYVVGLLGMYGAYELLHYREHVHPGIGPFGRYLRRHHFAHHFTDPSINHGVTSPCWDWVFGTYRSAEIIRVPRSLAMDWLIDPDTGDLRAEHAKHYQLRG